MIPTRYSERPLPPYSYVPRSETPHPVSDPAGHLYGVELPVPKPLSAENWQDNETYLYATDLFNQGYFWEAHETWESLWHVAGRRGRMADFLKGLIKLAAAGVKHREGNPRGVERHAARTVELLTSLEADIYCGLKVFAVISTAKSMQDTSVQSAIEPRLVLHGLET